MYRTRPAKAAAARAAAAKGAAAIRTKLGKLGRGKGQTSKGTKTVAIAKKEAAAALPPKAGAKGVADVSTSSVELAEHQKEDETKV